MRRISAKMKYLLLHVGLVTAALLFPLYRRFASHQGFPFGKCLLHNYLHVYCPLCGGTRAASAMLAGDLAGALRSNALVVLFSVLLLALDVIALTRLLRQKNPFFCMPTWVWWGCAGLFLLYFVLRNLLMIVYGYDPTGDLGRFWH